MAIADQRARLAVELTADPRGRVKTVLLTIEAKSAFDGKTLLWKP